MLAELTSSAATCPAKNTAPIKTETNPTLYFLNEKRSFLPINKPPKMVISY